MKTKTRLLLSFLLVSFVPLATVSYASLQAMGRMRSLAVEESGEALTRLGEEAIHQQALGVAAQVALYLEARPELLSAAPETLQADERLAAIAVQPVGETGYTAVYDNSGVVHFHADPAIVGTNMRRLADTLPAFWAIFAASLDGAAAAGYYEWLDADGVVRDKYMSCVPVRDSRLRVAATTYIDEFSMPVRETNMQLNAIFRETYVYLLAALVVLSLLAVGVALWLAWGISRPVNRLIQAAVALEQGVYQPEDLAAETARRDDLGRLARVFDRVAREVQARQASLQQQIQELRIQIDEVKRTREVAKITETEHFRMLQEQARRMRRQDE